MKPESPVTLALTREQLEALNAHLAVSAASLPLIKMPEQAALRQATLIIHDAVYAAPPALCVNCGKPFAPSHSTTTGQCGAVIPVGQVTNVVVIGDIPERRFTYWKAPDERPVARPSQE